MDDSKKIGSRLFSFEARISLIALLGVIIPLGIFALVSLQRSSEALTEAIAEGLEGRAILVARHLDNFLNERVTDARILSQADVLEGENVAGIIQYLTEIVEASEWIDDADVINPLGKIFASSGQQNEKGQLIWETFPGSKNVFVATSKADQGQVFVSEAQLLDTGPGILFLTPITDDTNTIFLGVLALEVNLRSLGRIVSIFNEGVIGDKYVYIVNNQGHVIITEDPSVAIFDVFPDLETQPGLLRAFSRQGDVGNLIYKDIVGDEVMAGYADMQEFGVNRALDWSIIAIAPLKEITQPARETRNMLLVFGIITAVVAMLVVYQFIRRLTRSLEIVARKAQQISSGDFSQRLSLETETGGVIGTLAVAFNSMAYKLQNSYAELEGKVEDRTRELESKNAELERFTYTVSHDLKSPLITIRGFLGLLEQDLAKGNAEIAQRDMKRIFEATGTMQTLLDDLLNYSRLGHVASQSRKLSLKEVADQALKLVAGQITNSKIRIDLSPDLPVVLGDHTRLVQVYQNLIDNAVKFMGPQPDPRIDIGVRQDGEEIVCYVEDNGIGIEPCYHDKVFGLFEQLGSSNDGTGIGLALVKRIIEVHEGRIWVESEGQGQGSSFCFVLPKGETQEG